MLEANVNTNQLFRNNSNSHNDSLLIAIEQFNHQINFLRARLASELTINSLLVERAQKLPRNQVSTPAPVPSLGFSNQQPISNGQKDFRVKKEESLPIYFCDRSFLQKDFTKTNCKLHQKLTEKEVRSKNDLSNGLKIEEKSFDQLDQNNEKNETKNIPKNYGKAILSFIQKNIQKYLNIVKPILQKQKMTVADLLNHIKKHKKEVNSIHYLKLMWGFQNFNDPIFKCIRILSHIFMRKYCLHYIFNSRIKNFNTHIKYRKRILQGIENPVQFTCIKQF